MASRRPQQSRGSNPAARDLGSKGGKKGGVARAKSLTSSQRSAVASKGGKAKAAKARTRPPAKKK